MVSTSLNSIDTGSHHQLDIIDKNKDANRNKLEPKPTQYIPSNRIHPIDIEATTGSSLHCNNMPDRTAGIENYAQRTPNFTLPLPTESPTTNHSALLTFPTTPHLPTVDDPRIPHTSSTQYGTIHPATTTYNNHSATLQTDLHRYPPLPLPQSQFDTNTNPPSYPETQHKLRSYSNHPEITTVVAPTTSCNISHGAENHTQQNTTNTSHAFRPPTDNTSNLTTTAHSHITTLVAHLQCLYHPPPTTHITTPILTQSIGSDP